MGGQAVGAGRKERPCYPPCGPRRCGTPVTYRLRWHGGQQTSQTERSAFPAPTGPRITRSVPQRGHTSAASWTSNARRISRASSAENVTGVSPRRV